MRQIENDISMPHQLCLGWFYVLGLKKFQAQDWHRLEQIKEGHQLIHDLLTTAIHSVKQMIGVQVKAVDRIHLDLKNQHSNQQTKTTSFKGASSTFVAQKNVVPLQQPFLRGVVQTMDLADLSKAQKKIKNKKRKGDFSSQSDEAPYFSNFLQHLFN